MIDKIQKNIRSSDSYVSMALGLAVVMLIGVLVFNYFQRGTTTDSQQAASDQTAEQGASGSANLPTTHTVAAGETLWTIAEKYYKSGYNWVDIQKANNLANANDIKNGQTLTIPSATPIIVGATPTPTGEVSGTASDQKSYTVGKGDFLWKIAVMQYGNGYKWVDIARANKLINPNVIHTGNVLILP